MRVLRFIVQGQKIMKDSTCDFTGITAGTSGYLVASFSLDTPWNGCKVAASFYKLSEEYPVVLNNGRCKIPAEALDWDYFDVKLTGIKAGYKIVTNKVRVEQERVV